MGEQRANNPQPPSGDRTIDSERERYADMYPDAVRAIAREEIEYIKNAPARSRGDSWWLEYELTRVTAMLAVIVEQRRDGGSMSDQAKEGGRITAARETLTVASIAMMGGDLGYTAESVVETMTEAIEGLLEIFGASDVLADLTVAEVKAERAGLDRSGAGTVPMWAATAAKDPQRVAAAVAQAQAAMDELGRTVAEIEAEQRDGQQ